MSAPRVSVLVVNWNTRHFLPVCLGSLGPAAGAATFDVWVVDNHSTDGSIEALAMQYPQVRVIANSTNAGFAAANNQGMAAAAGDYYLLLNSDAAAAPGSIARLIEVAEANPRAAVVGARLLNPDGTFQASHSRFPTLLREALILSTVGRRIRGPWYPSAGPELEKGPQPVEYVEGACLLVRRSAVAEVGGLDEGYWMYAEEVDWCRRMTRAGWQVWYQPEAVVYHWGGASSAGRRIEREADLYRSRLRYQRIHGGPIRAQAFKAMLLTATAIRWSLHRLLRATGRGNPRPVVGARRLAGALRDA